MDITFELDPRTLLFAVSLLMPIMIWVLLSMRRTAADGSVGVGREKGPRPAKGILAFAVGSIALTIGTFCLALRGVAPYAFSYLAGNGFAMLATGLFLIAVRRFDGHKTRKAWLLYGSAGIAALDLAVYLQPFAMLRVFAPNAVMATCCLLAAVSLYRSEAARTSHRFMTLASFACIGAAAATRAIHSIVAPQSVELLSKSSAPVALYLAAAVLGMSMTLGFVLMVSDVIRQRLLFLVTHDSLTEARTRRSWIEIASYEMTRAERMGKPASVLMTDLDHFKKVNDTFGHPVGDKALRQFAECARASLRKDDVLGRYGGEEFVVLLPATSAKDAAAVADRLRLTVANLPLETAQGPHQLTVSVGVASTELHGLDVAGLIAAADDALYDSKHNGRNRVSIASAPKTTGEGVAPPAQDAQG